jgi:hypothetical protein
LLSASAVDPNILACYDIESWARAPRKVIERWIDSDVKDGKIDPLELLGLNDRTLLHTDGSKVPSSLPKIKLNVINKSSPASDELSNDISHKRRRASASKEIPTSERVEEILPEQDISVQPSVSRRCSFEGCLKCAQGKTPFCIAHGGGRRCTAEGCTKVKFTLVVWCYLIYY